MKNILTTFDRVKAIIRQVAPSIEMVQSADALTDGLKLDSLDLVEITMGVEEEFDIDVLDADAEMWLTVGDIVAYLDKRQS